MVDIGHGINSIAVCIQEAASKITRSMSSSLKYLQSEQAAEQNSTSEQEALSEKPEEDGMKRLACREANFLWELRKYELMQAVLAACITCSAGLSPLGGFWNENDGAHLLGKGRVLRVTYRRVVSYCFITAFVASIFIIIILLWLWTLGMFCIMGAFGAVRRAISALFARDGGKKEASKAQETLEGVRMYVLLGASLVASITYQAGLEPPGGLWQENATDGLHHYRARAGDPIIPHTTYPRRYQAFFYCNAIAFVAWLVVLMLLLTKICRTPDLWLTGAYVAGNCRYDSGSDPAVDKDDPNSSIKRTPREATWRVACAAPHHMTGDQSLLLTGGYFSMRERDGNDGEVVMVHSATNGEAVPLRVQGSGSVRTESVALDDVWYVPGLDSNLVSTGQLARQGCAVNLGPGGCRITRGDALVGTARFTEACQFELDFLKVAASSM